VHPEEEDVLDEEAVPDEEDVVKVLLDAADPDAVLGALDADVLPLVVTLPVEWVVLRDAPLLEPARVAEVDIPLDAEPTAGDRYRQPPTMSERTSPKPIRSSGRGRIWPCIDPR
jgi:hypothetical protein